MKINTRSGYKPALATGKHSTFSTVSETEISMFAVYKYMTKYFTPSIIQLQFV